MERPELALQVREMLLEVQARWPSHIYDDSASTPFADDHCELSLAGAILQQVKHVVRVTLEMEGATWDLEETENCVSTLFPSFDPLTQVGRPVNFFQKLNYLEWGGEVIHWLMVSSALKYLHLTQPCAFLPDKVPHRRNSELETIIVATNSSLLNPESAQAKNCKPFLEHFTALKTVNFEINDSVVEESEDPDAEIVDFGRQGSFTVLMACIEPFVDTLTSLGIRIVTGGGNADWVSYTLPCEGFSRFKRLKSLEIPYQCLFGKTLDRATHLSLTPAMSLPRSLKNLWIHTPKLDILDWLARIQYFRDDVPNLEKVVLACLGPHGDGYNLFAFDSYPHPALDVLKYLKIGFEIENEDCWYGEWDDYELAALDLVAWQRSL